MSTRSRFFVVAAVAGLAFVAPASAAPLNTAVTTFANPTPAAGARFGLAVEAIGDVNGDGIGDFAVGAPGADRVDVYSGATRTRIRSITDPENEPGNDFGFSLANVGDVNGDGVSDLAVGAAGVLGYLPLPCMDPCPPAPPEQGRAFVFSGSTGGLIRKLSPGGTDFLAFGWSLAALGDVSGDGVPDVAVGAPTLLTNKFGQVYAFSGANGSVLWLVKESPEALASLGTSLASVPDLNGDGRRDILAGAIYHDGDPGPGSSLVGREYVLSGATGATIRVHDNPLGAVGKNFGFSAAGLGDQNGDGSGDYAASDPGASRVYLYNGSNGASIGAIPTPGSAGDNFGADLATSEDRDGDGRRDIWVSSPDTGTVRLINRNGGILLTLADPTPGGAGSILGFGFALAPMPDLGGDAGTDLVIGEPAEASESGAVHVVLITANRPPVANAGADMTAECAGPSGTDVTLDGSGSSDPDGDTLSYEWRDGSNQVVGTTATVTVSQLLGSETFTLKVSDGFGGTDTDTVTVTVADTTAPTVSVSLSPTSLWPANHRLVPITATTTATDLCSGGLTPILDSIVSNEPDNGLGDGDTPGDISGASIGTADTAFALRAERAGGGVGRSYVVTYRATDPSGNSTAATSTVIVPSSMDH